MTRRAWLVSIMFAAAGCAAVPPVENPTLLRPVPVCADENPILVSPGAPSGTTYAEVYEQVLDSLDDYFDIKPTSRYAGHIETLPRTAPGLLQALKPGSPDPRERLLASFQSIRHTAVVDIWSGERGGYRVYLEVWKELEDVSQPTRAPAGGAAFRDLPNVERKFEVVGGEVTDVSKKWIPVGRDYALEQQILKKLRDRRGCK
jgi:hypothetical protein